MRFVIGILVAGLALAARGPLTHEQMWVLPRVGAPVPSPDGKWVAFSVTEPAYDPAKQVSDIWLAPIDGSAEPRRLTYTKAGESGLSWSPDSKRLAFTTKREGDADGQVYVLDVVAGGEAQRITNQAGGASGVLFSPDGKRILYQSTFDPLAEQRKTRKANVRVFDTFPIRYWDHWLDEKRPHLFVQDAVPGSAAKDLLAGTKLAEEAGFDGFSTASGSDLTPVWAPDSQSIIFVATINKNVAAYADVSTQLYDVPVVGGEPRRITGGKDRYSSPYFRPDGRVLYALREALNGKVYNIDRLVKFAWPGGSEAQLVAPGLDRSINTFAATPDNRTVYALAEEFGHEKLFAIPADGGSAKLAVDAIFGCYTNLRIPQYAPQAVLVGTFDSSVHPPEIVRIDPNEKSHRLVTRFNPPKLADVDWQPMREYWFTSKRGRKIHSLVTLPPNFDATKKYPLIAFIHGGPHTMARDQWMTRWNYQLLAAPGYVILSTNYTGSTGYGEEFAQMINLDPLRGPGEELNEAVDEAIKQFSFIDGTRVAAGGASYGGHLANWLQATTTRYKCLFSHAGLINLESQWGTSDSIYHREVGAGGPVWEQGKVWKEQNPIRYAANFKTPMLLSVGENDYRVPLNQTLENWSVLQRLRIPSRLLVFPDENHWILKGENHKFYTQELRAWLAKWL